MAENYTLLEWNRNRNLLANLNAAIDFKRFLSPQFCGRRYATVVKDGFEVIKLFLMTVASFPGHPFWLGRQIPFVRIEIDAAFAVLDFKTTLGYNNGGILLDAIDVFAAPASASAAAR